MNHIKRDHLNLLQEHWQQTTSERVAKTLNKNKKKTQTVAKHSTRGKSFHMRTFYLVLIQQQACCFSTWFLVLNFSQRFSGEQFSFSIELKLYKTLGNSASFYRLFSICKWFELSHEMWNLIEYKLLLLTLPGQSSSAARRICTIKTGT